MPKNKEIKKVLVIGSGPIVIGQAAEFDFREKRLRLTTTLNPPCKSLWYSMKRLFQTLWQIMVRRSEQVPEVGNAIRRCIGRHGQQLPGRVVNVNAV